MQVTVKEYAELIRRSKDYKGTPIRIISCQSGAKQNGLAQQLADELGVIVRAPTEIVTVDDLGRMFVSDNDILADMWFHASEEEKKLFRETGEWKDFFPRNRK